MPDMINISLAAALRDAIARQAATNGTTQDTMADALLSEQIGSALALVERGDSFAHVYLTHPQLYAPFERATLNIRRETNARAEELTRKVSDQRGIPMPKGQITQALLWAAVQPVTDAQRHPVPEPPPLRDSFTVRISRDLNAALADRALLRAMSREALAATLLEQGFAALAADPELVASLQTQPFTVTAPTTTTLQVPRTFHKPLLTLAGQHFGGGISRTLASVLRVMLDRTTVPEAPAELPDHQILVSGLLYARIARLVRHGGAPSVRSFVEQSIAVALDDAGDEPARTSR